MDGKWPLGRNISIATRVEVQGRYLCKWRCFKHTRHWKEHLSIIISTDELSTPSDMSDSTCYWLRSNVPLISSSSGLPTMTPCGDTDTNSTVQMCCVGPDICLSDSICQFTHPLEKSSGYYIGGCTDETYSDPICSRHCSNNIRPDIVYNSTTELWACCSTPSTDKDCAKPGNETFQATPLDQLKRLSISDISVLSTSASLASNSISFISTSTSLPPKFSSTTLAATTVTVGSITQPSPSTSQATDRNDPGLGSDSKTGIVAGALIAGFLIFAGVVFLVRRSNRRKAVVHGPNRAADQWAHIFTGGKAELDSRVRVELDTGNNWAELDTGNSRAELI